MTIHRMRTSWWIHEAINAHSEYVILLHVPCFIVLFNPSGRKFKECLSLSLPPSEPGKAHSTPGALEFLQSLIIWNFVILISQTRTRKPQNAITHYFEIDTVGSAVSMYTATVLIPAIITHHSTSYFPTLISSVHTRILSVLLGRVV